MSDRSLGSILIVGFVAGLVVGVVTGCGADSPGGDSEATSCGSHTRPPPTTKAAQEVSFARDVVPIFQASCAFASCHGGANLNGVYLGAKGRTSDASAIRAGLLDGKGKGAVMAYVTPTSPNDSYLLRKLDGDLCNLDCGGGGKCGERMPKGGDPLEAAKLQTIETWIANGAPDN